MVVLTARPTELDRSPSARRLRENAPSLGISTIEVPLMSEEESRELLSALVEGAKAAPSLAERRALLGAAGGIPMVLELLVRDWLQDGRDSLALTFSAMTADLSHGSRAEHAYKALIERLIQELAPEVRNVLNLAAMLGNRLNDLEMYGLVDLTLARTMTGMTILTDLRLLRDNGKELGFRNELIRAQAYMDLPSTPRRALHSRVADRLIAGQTDRPVTGLELAWHCFRGGRPEQGRGYLISGAREAIDGGAVCEAELALLSAIPNLEDPWEANACLLLCEALQNQSRWHDSLALLCTHGEWATPDDAVRAFLLKTWAEWESGQLAEVEARERARTIMATGLSGSSADAKSIAFHTLGRLVTDTQDRELAGQALLMCKSMNMEAMTAREGAGFALLLSVSAHFAQSQDDVDVARKCSHAALALHGSNRTSHTTFTLNTIAGCVRSSRGLYEEAIPFFNSAMSAARALGHMNAIARSCTNLAMCFGRLAQYEEQLATAESGMSALAGLTDLVWFQLDMHAAWAHAMLGDTNRALSLLKEPRRRSRPVLPNWAQQGHLLLRSDGYRLIGRVGDSLRLAREATTLGNDRLYSRSYAGPYARAIAHISLEDGCVQAGLDRIEALLSDTELDAIDCVEVLSAEISMKSSMGGDCTLAMGSLAQRLVHLPPDTPLTLGRLGHPCALECSAGAPK
jgi:hypothetical protein